MGRAAQGVVRLGPLRQIAAGCSCCLHMGAGLSRSLLYRTVKNYLGNSQDQAIPDNAATVPGIHTLSNSLIGLVR